jgi:hypothetical protein
LAAFAAGELASYEVGVLDGEWAYAVIQMSRSDLLPLHPNHALDFSFNVRAFQQPGIRNVCIGPVPLRPAPGLHEYKLRMGFQVRPSRTALRVSPAAAWIAGSWWTERAIRLARRAPWLADRLEGLEIVVSGCRITDQQSGGGAPFGHLAGQRRETQ